MDPGWGRYRRLRASFSTHIGIAFGGRDCLAHVSASLPRASDPFAVARGRRGRALSPTVAGVRPPAAAWECLLLTGALVGYGWLGIATATAAVSPLAGTWGAVTSGTVDLLRTREPRRIGEYALTRAWNLKFSSVPPGTCRRETILIGVELKRYCISVVKET